VEPTADLKKKKKSCLAGASKDLATIFFDIAHFVVMLFAVASL
jgi:hypothetical protein